MGTVQGDGRVGDVLRHGDAVENDADGRRDAGCEGVDVGDVADEDSHVGVRAGFWDDGREALFRPDEEVDLDVRVSSEIRIDGTADLACGAEDRVGRHLEEMGDWIQDF